MNDIFNMKDISDVPDSLQKQVALKKIDGLLLLIYSNKLVVLLMLVKL